MVGGVKHKITNKMKNNNQFKVESGIKVPKSRSRYPFAAMRIGDSFLVPCGGSTSREGCVARSASHSAGKRYKMKFASRQCDNGVRIWRVE